MKSNLLERRVSMLNSISKGVDLKVVVESLSAKYGVKPKAIYQDWEQRDKWLPQIVQFQDEGFVYKLINGMEQIIPSAWYEYATADNSSARVGALKLAKETYMDLMRMLESLGLIPKEPMRIQQRIVMIKGRFRFVGPDGKVIPDQPDDDEAQLTGPH